MSAAPTSITWRWCAFDALTVRELDAIHQARQQVFVIEQHGHYLDADGRDAQSWHLAAWSASDSAALPVAYARVVAPGHRFAEPSIGRVLTLPAARGVGLGRELVRRAVMHTVALYPGAGIRISAQSHLVDFYAGFGFVPVGEPYREEDIPHTEMLRAP